MADYDHVVLGAGIVGSWTALHLVKLGKNVLLLEQFREPHTRGSSHGQSRLTRCSYAEDFFADMMPTAFQMWKNLEEESGKQIFLQTGLLNITESPEDEEYKKMVSNMKRLCPEQLEELSGKEVRTKYPNALNFKDTCGFLWDKSGGTLFAHKALLTIQDQFRKRGGELWDNCKVTQIIPNGGEVKIITTKGDITVKSLVVCAGTWTSQLLTPHLIPSLPLQPQVVKVYYWKEKVKGSCEQLPATLYHLGPDVYSLPIAEYPGLMKVCIHGGTPISSPDERDKTPANLLLEQTLKDFIMEHFPMLEPEPVIIETCMYTVTPDEYFILDTLPKHKNIVLGAGFSGTGFKTSPAVGKILSQLATGAEPFVDISSLRLSRFSDS